MSKYLLLLSLTILCLTACNRRMPGDGSEGAGSGAEGGDPTAEVVEEGPVLPVNDNLKDLVGVDFRALGVNDYKHAIARVGAVLVRDFPEMQSGYNGPLAVLDAGSAGVVVVDALNNEIHLSTVNGQGVATDAQNLAFGKGYRIVKADLSSVSDGAYTLEVKLGVSDQRAQVTKLTWLLGAFGHILMDVRNRDGQVSAAQLGVEHAALVPPVMPIDSSNTAATMQSLIALAQSEQKNRRGESSIRSHLADLSSATDPKVAELAAYVWTLPY